MAMDSASDPGDYTVEEVLVYLAGDETHPPADEDERARVFDAERAGKARVGILQHAPYDPGEHTVDEVNAHLAGCDDAERERILQAEREGRARVGILNAPGADEDPAEERDGFLGHAADLAEQATSYAEDAASDLADLRDSHIATFNAADATHPGVIADMARLASTYDDVARAIATLGALAGELGRSLPDA